MNKIFKVLLGLGILAGGIAISGLLWITRPIPEKTEKQAAITQVDYIEADLKTVTFDIPSQGIVEAHRRSQLASEVPGKVIYVDPLFEVGHSVPANQTLIRIDPTDYEAAIAQAEATLADAESALSSEEARVEQSRRDWERDNRRDNFEDAPSLVRRVPQLKSAKARVASAAEAVNKAKQDKARTEIKAPYDSVIAAKHTEYGSYLAPGAMVAEVFESGPYEVRLPVSVNELRHLKINDEGNPAGDVNLSATASGKTRTWKAEIIRNEGEIDRQTRSLYLVAKVGDATGSDGIEARPGLFVSASIPGKPYPNVAAIPFQAFTKLSQVLIVTKDGETDKLYPRDVEVLYRDGNTVYVKAGLDEGERVCITEVPDLITGLEVKAKLFVPDADSSDLTDNSSATSKP